MIVEGKTFLLLVYSLVVIGQQSQTGILAGSPDSHKPSTTTTTTSESHTQHNKYSNEDKVLIDSFETALLGLFGLSKRPRPNKKVHIPPYMYELYRYHTGMDLVVDMDAVGSRRKPLYSANTIRSFTDESKNTFHSGTAEDSNRATLFFNISTMPEIEVLKGAELRIYREQSNATQQDLTAEQLNTVMSKQHRIDIYEIIRPSTRTREAITRLVDTRTVRPHRTSWESFDISSAIARWRKTPHSNFGLQVHFRTKTGESSQLQHVRLKRSVATPEEQWHLQKPLVVTYSDDDKAAKSSDSEHNNRNRRSRRASRGRKNKRRTVRTRKKKKGNLCQRRRLYVDFSEVGWTDWIVAPPGYEAFYCHGTCPSVLADTMNSTNHAIVQSFVHAVDPEAAPKPCCVPTELSAISLLYVNENEKVQLKKYNDMAVEACGCR